MKKGISLIVLVITIIVMIILAASVVASLSNTGIIGKANQATDLTNKAQVENLATLVWSDNFMAGKRGDDLKEEVLKSLEDYTDEYNIDVTNEGIKVSKKIPIPEEWKASVREVTEDGIPIPVGFVKSPYPNEGTKDGGLVIYALTESEILQGKTTITDKYQVALETRNQFVWVPVDSNKFEEQFVRNNHGIELTISSTLGKDYWELELDSTNMPKAIQNTSYVSPETLAEAIKMYKSVKKYGGFYIGRYEVGMNSVYEDASRGYITTRVSISENTNSNLSVTMAKYPYAGVPFGTSFGNEIGDSTAVSLAREFYPSDETTYGVVSTLTYGVQWDRTLAWWKEQNPNFNLNSSTGYGVHNDTIIESKDLNANAKYSIYSSEIGYKYGEWSTIIEKTSKGAWLLTTGAYKKAKIYNIYDMSGNLWEWTMEGLNDNYRILRGGWFYYNYMVSNRGDGISDGTAYCYGFRPSLYIK